MSAAPQRAASRAPSATPPRATSHVAAHLDARGAGGLFTRLTRVALRLQAFQERCLGPLRLRFIDYSVLRVLELSGRPHRMSPTRLSEIVLRPTGGMTQILDRLERDGLVERSPDPSDRRRVTVALTKDGLRTARRAGKRYEQARAKLLAGLSPAETATIDSAIRRLLVVFGDPDGRKTPKRP